MQTPPNWRLPPGVTPGLWDYLHDEGLAKDCDDRLKETPLLAVDRRFAERHLPGRGRVIDLGCGTGRMLAPLAQKGCSVVGVDLAEPMLRVAREKVAGADLVKANLVELDCLAEESFDAAVCLFSTLGMVAGQVERRRVVGHAFRLLRAGGIFVLHVHNRWFNFWDRAGRRWLIGNLVRSLLGNENGGDRVMPPHSGGAGWPMHLFTRREVRRLLVGAGFEIVKIEPVSLRADGRLPWPGWFGWLRAYGYLVAARKHQDASAKRR